MNWIKTIPIIDEIRKIKSGKAELREFGLTIGAALVILGDLALLGSKASCLYLAVGGTLFLLAGLLVPHILKPLQKIWIAFAIILGFFVSRVILAVLFYAVMTPIGLLLKILGRRDILDEKIDKEKDSYWNKRPEEEKARESYENQY